MSTDLQTLPIDQVIPNTGQPRKHFDAVALEELAASLRTYGLLEPIIVRPISPLDGQSRFEIIAGERRWRASHLAGLTTIDAIVRDENDDDAFELSMIENVVRADMNPIEEAAGYQRLVDSGLTVAVIAERIGKTPAAITGRMKLMALAEPIRDLVAAGQLDAWSAGHLTKLSHEGQYKVIRARTDGLPIHDVARLASAIFEVEAQMGAFDDLEMVIADAPAPKVRQAVDTAAALATLNRVAAAIEDGAEVNDLFASQVAAIASRITKSTRRAAMRKMAGQS